MIEIVNCGSINEATKRIYIAQPNLSDAVKELETEMGIEHFIRMPRGSTLSARRTAVAAGYLIDIANCRDIVSFWESMSFLLHLGVNFEAI